MQKGDGIHGMKRILMVFPLLFPLVLGLFMSVLCLVNRGDWSFWFDEHDAIYYAYLFPFSFGVKAVLSVIIFVGIALSLYVSMAAISKRLVRIKQGKFIISILCGFLATIFRIVVVILFSGKIGPYSDYGVTWLMAKGDMQWMDSYQFWPNYITYAMVMRVIAHFTRYHFEGILFANAVADGITGAFIYLMIRRLTGSEKAGVFGSILYAMYPAGILYISCSSQEHICIALMTMGTYMVLKSLLSEKVYSKVLYIVCSGICYGISDSLKTFSVILLIAMTMAVAAYLIDHKSDVKKVVISVILIFVVFTTAKVTKNVMVTATEHVFSFEYDGGDVLYHFLSVGLNRQGEGQTNLGEINKHYTFSRMNGMSREDAKAETLDIVLNDWKGKWNEIPSFFFRKYIWAFQDDYACLRTMIASLDEESLSPKQAFIWQYVSEAFPLLTQSGYILILILGICSCCSYLRKSDNAVCSYGVFFCGMVIFGYFCLITLSEAQSRYKCLIFPYVLILIATTLYKLLGEKVKSDGE